MKVKCYHCKGTGREPVDKFLAVLSLGITALIDLSLVVACEVCEGRGKLKFRDKQEIEDYEEEAIF